MAPEAAPRRLTALAVVYCKGLAMGGADSVPGVSGGTIALITGIYERFVGALTSLHPRILRHVPRLHRRDGRRAFWGEARAMDLPFLIALGLGVVTAVVTVSRLVHGALGAYRPETYAFFFGLIAASAVVLYAELDVRTAGQVAAGVVGFVAAFLLSGASSGGLVPSTLPFVAVTGAVAVTAMVLPGVSGAFVLVLLGQYEYLTGVLSAFVDHVVALPTAGLRPGLVDAGAVVAVFGVGGLVGLFSVAHVIRRALVAYRMATLSFLVSLMVGSLRLPVLEVRTGVGAWTPSAAAGVAAAGLVGAAIVVLLDRYTADLSLG